ncbi:MAG: hypothetical protein P8X86_02195 [Desulfofustis sp.]
MRWIAKTFPQEKIQEEAWGEAWEEAVAKVDGMDQEEASVVAAVVKGDAGEADPDI